MKITTTFLTLLVLLVSLGSRLQAEDCPCDKLTIDAFETPVTVMATRELTPVFDFVNAQLTEVIGGQRELTASLPT